MKLLRRFRRAAATLATACLRTLPGLLRDLTGLAGAASVAYGAWQVYPPAGWIVGGGLALIAAWRLVPREPETPPSN